MTDNELEKLDSRLDRITTISEANTLSIEANTLSIAKLEAESKKWDERFFQLSRDTLNFSRNIIVTAAVVTVVAPLLKESVTFALELIKKY
jgi:MerR family transcriptional regulator, repressor of the yfmOP operon